MIRNKLPKKTKLVPVQGFVPEKLKRLVDQQLVKDKSRGYKANWNNLMRALLKTYLEESGVKSNDEDE